MGRLLYIIPLILIAVFVYFYFLRPSRPVSLPSIINEGEPIVTFPAPTTPEQAVILGDTGTREFSTNIDNRYFTLTPGKQMVYEGDTDEGFEKLVLIIPGNTHLVARISTLVYKEQIYIDDLLITESKHYLAQDQEDNVWYFGRDIKHFDDEKITSKKGSWRTGDRKSRPGMWIVGDPKVDQAYRQQYIKDVIEDMNKIVAVGQRVEIARDTYDDCIKVYEWSGVNEEVRKYIYYCSEVGGVALIENIGTGDRLELVDIK